MHRITREVRVLKLDITQLLSGKVRSLPFSFEIGVDGDGVPLPPVTASLSSPVRVSGVITDSGTCLYLRLDAEVDYVSACDRCADPVSGTVKTHIERMVAERGIVEDEESDEYFIACDGILDLDGEILEELMLSFPSRVLCSEDCRGICPDCGQNLNRGDCGCAERRKNEIDPRWQSLAKLLKSDGDDDNDNGKE